MGDVMAISFACLLMIRPLDVAAKLWALIDKFQLVKDLG